MENTLICLVLGAACLLIGVTTIINPARFRRVALRSWTGRYRWEKFVPFGGPWMQTHEKEHLFWMRLSALIFIAMGLFALYIGIVRLR
jgi:uncharacterized membrane protein HdeD (DUF308 family)